MMIKFKLQPSPNLVVFTCGEWCAGPGLAVVVVVLHHCVTEPVEQRPLSTPHHQPPPPPPLVLISQTQANRNKLRDCPAEEKFFLLLGKCDSISEDI